MDCMLQMFEGNFNNGFVGAFVFGGSFLAFAAVGLACFHQQVKNGFIK